MFIQDLGDNRISLRCTNENDLFKNNHTSKYVKENVPALERPLKDNSTAALEEHMLNYMKFAIRQRLHYQLWHIVYTHSLNLKCHSETVKRATAQYPAFKPVLEIMAAILNYQKKLKNNQSHRISQAKIVSTDVSGPEAYIEDKSY